MKTAMIARFVLGAGAIFAVAGLVGCGAGEQGSGESGAIGSSSEALTVDAFAADLTAAFDTDWTTGITDPLARGFSSSCVIKDTGAPAKEYLLIAGGLKSDGSVTNEAFLYDPAVNKWARAAGNLGTARMAAEMIQVSDTKCLIVGGLDARAGHTIASAEVYTWGSGFAAASGGAGTDALVGRTRMGLKKCGDGKALLIGGFVNPSGTITRTTSVQWWNGTNVWKNVTSLGSGRENLAVVTYDPGTNSKFLVFGGYDGSAESNAVEVINAANACAASTDVTVKNNLAGIVDGSSVPLPRNGAVGLPLASNHVLIAAGFDGSTAPTATLDLAVTWTVGSEAATFSANGPTLTGGLVYPKIVKAASDYFLLGGTNGAGTANQVASGATTPTSNNIQKYVSTGFVNPPAAPTALRKDRAAHVAEYVASKVYAATGLSIAGGVETFLSSNEQITP